MSDLKIKRQITSKKRYYTGTNPCDYITVHQTGNTSAGADAQAHANLQSNGNVRVASWQWTVDGFIAIQSYEDYRKCWHAGDGLGAGNTRSIGIEICINSDGDYEDAVHNGAKLVAIKMRQHGISISHVVQHNKWSSYGKNCPAQIRGGKSGIDWDEFLDLCLAYYKGDDVTVKPEPEEKPSQADGETDVDGFWGTDVTIELQEIFDTPIDGEVWNQTQHWLEENPGLTWGWKTGDGKNGSPLIRKMQETWLKAEYKDEGGTIDGRIGPKFIRALQRKLKKTKFSNGDPYYSGLIDGKLDHPSRTIKALQKAINYGKINF